MSEKMCSACRRRPADKVILDSLGRKQQRCEVCANLQSASGFTKPKKRAKRR